ncbi:hypothetical protein BgAZ_301310 [Babesia gibsoni]|uniref:RRM domain-containing protein n=1 Tax=Babesia gibsoni TaxID=33632 RepID=A0AAD8LNC9_BABGI|nr:hypothetical protein BgAZ_301310 [Babesia gibsoni]
MESEKSSSQSVLVRNLNFTTTSETVKETFEKFGDVKDVYLPLDYKTKRPRGFGFIEFRNEQDALEAVKAIDNTELDGSVVVCCLAQDRRKSPNSMRRAYRNANSSRRGGYMRDDDRDLRRGDYYGRQRSRSRSPGPRYSRRSFSYERRHSPPRDEHQYYYRRDMDHSPQRYSRPYDYDQDYRDHRGDRDSRQEHLDRPHRRYGGRPYHDDYPRDKSDRRRSPPRSREGRQGDHMLPESHDGRSRRPMPRNT